MTNADLARAIFASVTLAGCAAFACWWWLLPRVHKPKGLEPPIPRVGKMGPFVLLEHNGEVFPCREDDMLDVCYCLAEIDGLPEVEEVA